MIFVLGFVLLGLGILAAVFKSRLSDLQRYAIGFVGLLVAVGFILAGIYTAVHQ